MNASDGQQLLTLAVVVWGSLVGIIAVFVRLTSSRSRPRRRHYLFQPR